jgi:hypothetical protein
MSILSFFQQIDRRFIAIGIALMGGWQIGHAQSPATNKLVIVLVDQTDSFGTNAVRGSAETLYWDEALQKANAIVKSLHAKDEFVLLAINDNGFVDENILINLQQFERSGLKARLQTRQVAEQILKLKRPERKYHRTDITGALHQAAHIANRENMARTIVICFSDMIQEPNLPTAAEVRDLRFPDHTKGYFYFVDASGLDKWKIVLQTWTPLLRSAQMDIGGAATPNFFQYGETDRALQRMVKEW